MSAKSFDVRNQPAYTLAEAARYVKLPAATLRSWVAGRAYPRGEGKATFQPLIKPTRAHPTLLSFNNLIEAHVLRSLRTDHGVAIKQLREAIKYAEQSLHIDRLLLSKYLRTHAGKVFLKKYGELIDLPASGQLAMIKLFEAHLKRVEWDNFQFPIRLYPFVSGSESPKMPIAIDPSVAFGRPIVCSAGISTRIIAERIDAGETIAELSDDYGLSKSEIEQAALYERAA